ncbi:Gfo/Idh/MocA family protein [Antarctobacter jejuensis]|uniref:Gfo/Idh/MocA family protein n=1 Tax=Antarctobacter jejuensis TaxID=1439938 RepID=UPI003FD3769C
MPQVRYAVVGAGWISQIAFMPAVAQTANATIAAIVSGNAETAQKLAEFHDVPEVVGYDAYDALLASDRIDAVYIALPNSMHADYTIRALKAGKHALVEKPLGLTVAECEAMVAAATESGALLMTAYRLHSDPGTVEVLERIRQGEIGEPRYFTSMFSFQSDPGNHRLQAEHWGGPLQDIGVYCLNAARQVFAAEPTQVFAMSSHGDGDPRFAQVEESVAVTLRFPGDRLAQFIASFGADDIDRYSIVGTRGVIDIDPGFRFETDVAFRRQTGGVEQETYTAPATDHFAAQTAYFSDCILTGTQPEPDGGEGLADVAVLRAIERSIQTGQPQPVSLPPRPRHAAPDTVRLIPRTDRRLVF